MSINITILIILILSTAFISGLFYVLLKIVYKKIDNRITDFEKKVSSDYNQIEALFSIFSVLKIDKTLPPFRGWAISPDFATILLNQILDKRPKIIVESGSGMSTILISYILKKNNFGHLYSLEHKKNYAAKTENLLISHNLVDKATVIKADLIPFIINNSEYKWYDINFLKPDQKIDMLIIDGPPSSIQPKARYPALPLLEKYLNDDAIILIDDCKREGDLEIVKLWLSEFTDYVEEWYDIEKGAVILKKRV